jgi:hypothetical protein
LHHHEAKIQVKASAKERKELTQTSRVGSVDDLMLIRLDNLEASKSARLRKSTGRIIGDDPSYGFGI